MRCGHYGRRSGGSEEETEGVEEREAMESMPSYICRLQWLLNPSSLLS